MALTRQNRSAMLLCDPFGPIVKYGGHRIAATEVRYMPAIYDHSVVIKVMIAIE